MAPVIASLLGPDPEGADIEDRGSAGRASTAPATATTPSPAAWKSPGRTTPTKWSNNFFENLFGFEWELTKSPAGAHQWTPKDGAGVGTPGSRTTRRSIARPAMLTTDLALRVRPGLREDLAAFPREPGRVRRRLRPGVVQAHPSRHGSEGALSRPAGPAEGDPDLAGPDSRRSITNWSSEQDIADLKAKILASGLSVSELVSTAWASASTFRGSDKRGGANGARIRLPRRRTGRSTSRPNWRRCSKSSKASRRPSTPRRPARRRSRSPT